MIRGNFVGVPRGFPEFSRASLKEFIEIMFLRRRLNGDYEDGAASALTTIRGTACAVTMSASMMMMIRIEIMLVSGRIEETPWDNYEARGPQQIVNYPNRLPHCPALKMFAADRCPAVRRISLCLWQPAAAAVVAIKFCSSQGVSFALPARLCYFFFVAKS